MAIAGIPPSDVANQQHQASTLFEECSDESSKTLLGLTTAVGIAGVGLGLLATFGLSQK